MRGDVTAPLLEGEVLNFDNLTIVLDAISGERLHVEAFFEAFGANIQIPIFFDPSVSCAEQDLGELSKIFRATCPYPDVSGSGSGSGAGDG